MVCYCIKGLYCSPIPAIVLFLFYNSVNMRFSDDVSVESNTQVTVKALSCLQWKGFPPFLAIYGVAVADPNISNRGARSSRGRILWVGGSF